MTRMFTRRALLAALVLVMASSSSASTPFLQQTMIISASDPSLPPALKHVLGFPATIDVSRVNIDVNQIKDKQDLTFELFGQMFSAEFVRSEVVKNPDKSSDSYIWYGNLMPHGSVTPIIESWQDPLHFVTLVKSGDRVTGLIHQGREPLNYAPLQTVCTSPSNSTQRRCRQTMTRLCSPNPERSHRRYQDRKSRLMSKST